jgi:hypothetical protein
VIRKLLAMAKKYGIDASGFKKEYGPKKTSAAVAFTNQVSLEDRAGVGVGVFQITVSPTSGVTAAQAGNLTWAANYAGNLLSSNMSYLGNKFPNFTPDQLLQATAASYNMNPYNPKNFTGNPNTIDDGTANGNYGTNVVQIMEHCF